ncbi:MAG: transposase [Planctomycetota bacterium]|nr:transposase [Planctomycetota bacterium]
MKNCKNGLGLIKLALQMLVEVKGWFPERRFMMGADGFYATLAGSGAMYTHLISRMRCDAAIYELPKKKQKHQRGHKCKKGRRLPTPSHSAEAFILKDRIDEPCGRKRILDIRFQIEEQKSR